MTSARFLIPSFPRKRESRGRTRSDPRTESSLHAGCHGQRAQRVGRARWKDNHRIEVQHPATLLGMPPWSWPLRPFSHPVTHRIWLKCYHQERHAPCGACLEGTLGGTPHGSAAIPAVGLAWWCWLRRGPASDGPRQRGVSRPFRRIHQRWRRGSSEQGRCEHRAIHEVAP